MPGYTEIPSYREPLMFDGGEEVAVAKAGCENADKCCMCFPIETGLKVVAGISWCNTVGMIIIAFVISGLMVTYEAVSDGTAHMSVTNANGSTMSFNGSNGSFTNAVQTVANFGATPKITQHDVDSFKGDVVAYGTAFMIITIIAAVLQLTASVLMAMWCCCGSADKAKSSKYMYWGAIAQAVGFLTFAIAFFVMGVVQGIIGVCVDLLFYIYIVFVAKRFHAQMQGGVKALIADAEEAVALNEV